QHVGWRRAAANDGSDSGVRLSGRADILRTELSGIMEARWRLCRQDTSRCQASRFTGRAADQVRSRDQCDDGQGTQPPCAAHAHCPRRRGDRVKRREFITLLGGAAAAMPVIGYLNFGSPESDAFRLTGLRRGLNQTGYVEGRNFVIEYRWAGNQPDRLPTLAHELVQLRSRGVSCS